MDSKTNTQKSNNLFFLNRERFKKRKTTTTTASTAKKTKNNKKRHTVQETGNLLIKNRLIRIPGWYLGEYKKFESRYLGISAKSTLSRIIRNPAWANFFLFLIIIRCPVLWTQFPRGQSGLEKTSQRKLSEAYNNKPTKPSQAKLTKTRQHN